MKVSDPNSNRSKKRKNRGFISLEKSSRKHIRAAKRLGISKVAIPNPSKDHQQHIGGSIDFHC